MSRDLMVIVFFSPQQDTATTVTPLIVIQADTIGQAYWISKPRMTLFIFIFMIGTLEIVIVLAVIVVVLSAPSLTKFF